MNAFSIIFCVFNLRVILGAQDGPAFYKIHWENIADCLNTDIHVVDVRNLTVDFVTRSDVALNGNILILKDLEEGITVQITLLKRSIVGKWYQFEINGITSFRHDACQFIKTDEAYFKPIALAANIPRECPVKQGTYVLDKSNIDLNLPNMIPMGCFKFQVDLYDPDENSLMCFVASLKITPPTEESGSKCE